MCKYLQLLMLKSMPFSDSVVGVQENCFSTKKCFQRLLIKNFKSIKGFFVSRSERNTKQFVWRWTLIYTYINWIYVWFNSRMSFVDFSNIFTMLEVCHLSPECWKCEPSIHHRKSWAAAVGHREWRRGYNAGGAASSRESKH